MALTLVPRGPVSRTQRLVTPLIAFAVALAVAAVVLVAMGKSLSVAFDTYIR